MLDAVPGHFHDLDAVAVRILDPHAAIAIDPALGLARLAERYADTFQLLLGLVDVLHSETPVGQPNPLRLRHVVADTLREEFEVNLVGDTQIDDPRLVVGVEQPEELGEAELGVEGYRS